MRFLQNRFTQLAIWLGGAWLVFGLPYLVPPTRRMVSDSYTVGFNNGVALLGLTAILLLLFICRLGAPAAALERWNRQWDDLLRPATVKPAEYLVPGVFAALQSALMWLWYLYIPFTYYGEMGYTVARSELTLLGQVPYKDFEWNYGPALLYFPALLVRASLYHLSADQAYMVGLVLSTFLSFGAVYFVLSQLNLSKGQRIALFLLLCLSFNLGLGVNGTQGRFIAPYLALFLIHRLGLRSAPDKRHPFALLGLMAGSVLGCFLISPETGMVVCAGLLTFVAIKAKNGARSYLPLAALAVGLGVAPLLALSSAYLRSMASFGGGAANFPIVPSGQILFYLVTLAILVPALGAYAFQSKTPGGALSLSLGTMMLLFSAAALGRCDVGHVFYNGLGLFLVGLAFFVRHRPRYQLYPILFGLLFTLAYPFTYFFHYSNDIQEIVQRRNRGARRVDRHFLTANAPDSAIERQLQGLKQLRHIGLPLGGEEGLELALKRAGLYCFEYYPYPSMEARTRPQLDRKLHDVSRMPYLLVPKARMVETKVSADFYARNEEKFMTQVMLYPVTYRVQKWPLFPETEIRDCIRAHFRPLAVRGDNILFVNRSLTKTSD